MMLIFPDRSLSLSLPLPDVATHHDYGIVQTERRHPQQAASVDIVQQTDIAAMICNRATAWVPPAII